MQEWLRLISENIPDFMKEKKQWVGMRVDDNGSKVPISPVFSYGLGAASISDPNSWGSFEDAKKLVDSGYCIGVAYALIKEDGLIFIDIDQHIYKCKMEEEKKLLTQQYKAMLQAVEPFQTYKEKSVSGSGVHLLAKGSLDPSLKTGGSPTMPIEIYDNKRFVIMTGHKLNDFGVEDDDWLLGAIRQLHSHNFPPKDIEDRISLQKAYIPVAEDLAYTDEQVLEAALRDPKFNLLWNNKWEEVVHEDGSATYSAKHYADMGLIKKLAFYTGNCPSQMERLFRQSPAYQAYGKDGNYIKYEKDIRKDIETATSTCKAVYAPLQKRVMQQVAPQNGEVEVVNSSSTPAAYWKPNFPEIWKILTETDEEKQIFKNPVLIGALKNYVLKNQDRTDIQYIPYLFKEDKNVNGATAIVKMALGDRLKYSKSLKGYYYWTGKQYKDFGDPEMLIHPLTEILSCVEHSVFHYAMTEVATMSGDKTQLEETVLKLFAESKRFVDVRLAKNILLKYKGMDFENDIKQYYETPNINMQNGVLDLNTRTLYPHSPAYSLYKITGCDYDPQADCPEFKAMVKRIMPEEQDRKELQKAFGLCLAKEQLPAKKVLMLLVGPKDTGKTTLINAVIDTLGEYGSQVDNSLLMQSRKDKARGPEFYDFRDALIITTSETNENDRLDTAKIKALTGQTTQSIRNNFATSMDKFTMIGLIFIDSNYKPYIPPKEVATWDRLRLFPFQHPIIKKDPNLKKKLDAERVGIFNWLLKGLEMALEDGEIFETPNMAAYKRGYQEEMDITGQFFSECTEESENPADKIQTSIFFATYKNWAKDNGFSEIVRGKFYEECNKRYERKKSGVEYYIKVKFSALGLLYSSMSELTTQQFAKQKRALLQGDNPSIGYNNLKKLYYERSWGWFVANIKIDMKYKDYNSLYYQYSEWCIENNLVPLKSRDFNAKISFIFHNMDFPTPEAKLLEKSKDIWAD